MQKAKKDYLTKLSVREIRLEAKKSSIHLYSRKNKEELVELILNDQENVLIEQSFVKNPDIAISDLLTETIAKLGENISIARFTRFQLGETAAKSESPDSE